MIQGNVELSGKMMDSVGNQEHSSQLPYRMESSPSLCPTSSYSTDQQRNYLWQQYSSSNQFIVENPQIYIGFIYILIYDLSEAIYSQ